MDVTDKKSHCGSCLHNVNNYCMSTLGYYFYGESISDEEVECEDWIKNQHSYGERLKQTMGKGKK